MAESRARRPPPEPEPRRLWQRLRGEHHVKDGHGSHEVVTEQERFIVEALGDLREMDVRDVMTPRVDVVALSIPVNAEDVAQAVRETGHSCFPVVHDDLDDLVGVLYVNDLFRSGRHPATSDVPAPGPLDISRRVRQPLIVPESLGLLEALAEMRRQRRAFAVVVDEYGGVAGVITIKDLLEPLVGDLQDEFDSDDEPEIVRVDSNRWLIDGRASVDEVNERLGFEIPDGEYVTLGGYLFDAFGHIPEEGERVNLGDDWELRIVEMDKRRIARVVARQLNPTDVDERVTPPGANGSARSGTQEPSNGSTKRSEGTSGRGAPNGANRALE